MDEESKKRIRIYNDRKIIESLHKEICNLSKRADGYIHCEDCIYGGVCFLAYRPRKYCESFIGNFQNVQTVIYIAKIAFTGEYVFSRIGRANIVKVSSVKMKSRSCNKGL